jgi:signal transduction histidine kinase
MNKPVVLIVANNPSDTNDIEVLIKDEKIELLTAGSEKEAIDLATRLEFALVIIKATSSVIDGFEVAQKLKNDKRHELLNILYITDDCCETNYPKYNHLIGVVDIIASPIMARTLKAKVDSLINIFIQRKRLEDELEQRKIREVELAEANRRREEADIAKSQFLSTMSHEIRTPLNAIINTINLLISEDPRGDQLEDMDVLKFSAENLLQLINEILDYSKIDSGKIEFEEIDFNIRKLISGIKKSLQYVLVKNGNTLDFYIEEKVPTFIIGDSIRLAQIFFNLVGNALKFTEKGKVSLTTEVAQDLGDHIELKFSVSDTGIGIPEDKQKNIFEAFMQASASTTREYGGTGLGLAITRMLVEKQGGRIEVISKPGVGSTFFVFLKFKKSIKNQIVELTTTSTELHSFEGINILVVEDNLVNQNIVSRLLAKWNAVTDTAENGRMAVQKVLQNHYHLVLMDLHMPEMNGYEAAKQIRKMDGDYFKTIPILAVTASAFAEDRRQICASGMNGYIIKPFHPVELNLKISRFLGNMMPVI